MIKKQIKKTQYLILIKQNSLNHLHFKGKLQQYECHFN